MNTGININANILTWAIARAGKELPVFASKVPEVQDWIDGKKIPTIKQLEAFSRKVHLPFGYLFLPEPPIERLPIPYFRTTNTASESVNLNVYDTILLMQQRQDWLSDYLKDNEFEPLPFVGKFRGKKNVQDIVNDIRQKLDLPEKWASQFSTWKDALDNLAVKIENKGIITIFNGVVENNNKRAISVDECRGFVLVDEMAPFMFVNNSDAKAAQMFTIAHELAHIWTGHSAGFDFRKLQPANDPNEILCDKVAAELLVPEKFFNLTWQKHPDIGYLARFFKVSEIVVTRRALDLGKITKEAFFRFYDEYSSREFKKKEKKSSGGDFYATTQKRLSLTFAAHINNAVKSGSLLYRDAWRLTSLKGSTFETFFNKHF